MELVLKSILILALIDFLLTIFWIYRWQSIKKLKKFKNKLPVKTIEANPIINHTINKFGLYPGVIIGYAFVLLIQLALGSLHNIIGWIIVAILAGAIVGHIKNNITTSEKYIVGLTKEYNLVLKRKLNKNKKHVDSH